VVRSVRRQVRAGRARQRRGWRTSLCTWRLRMDLDSQGYTYRRGPIGKGYTLGLAYQGRGDIRVACGGPDTVVAEQNLDHAQVGASFEQVRGKAVSEHVGLTDVRDWRGSFFRNGRHVNWRRRRRCKATAPTPRGSVQWSRRTGPPRAYAAGWSI
jgi:hypothetical protein